MAHRSEFELMGKIGIGQYIPTGSVVHRIDARMKLLLGTLLIGVTIFISSITALLLLFVIVLFGLILSKVQVRLAFISMRRVLPYLFILAAIQMFAVPQFRFDAAVLWEWKILVLTDRSLMSGLLLIGRFVVIVSLIALFSFTTTTTELMHGVEHILRPLQRVRFPAHETALVINIAIRFVPILTGEAERIMRAQASRGADFGTGRYNFIRRFKRMLPLFVPLFILSLQHAQKLAEAMESRCYMGGSGRTQLIQLRTERKDFAALIIGILALSGVLCLSIFHVDRTIWRGLKTILS
jgi:energy-coupling factor transport system permease protein